MTHPIRDRQVSRCAKAIATVAASALLQATAPSPAIAAERPGVNLGATSFFDGFGGLTPGWALIQYGGNASFNVFNGPDGDKLYDWTLNSTYYVPQITYTSDIKLLDGTLGWNVILPLSGQSSHPLPTNGWGPGDPLVGVYLEFAPVMSEGKPIFAHGVEFDAFIPIGRNDPAKPINPGTNYWSITPLYKATWLFAPKWELSGRLTYIHNFEHAKNDGVRHTGDGFWLNFAGSYEIFDNFHLGANGYWLQQLEKDAVAPHVLALGKQVSLYFGPGFSYTIDKNNILNLNIYIPMVEKNAFSDGVLVNLQYIHQF